MIMRQRILLGLLWLGLLGYSVVLAPPNQPDTFELIQQLSTGQLAGINPAIVALFYIMGIWPLIYGGLLFTDGKTQSAPAWPFAIASFGVGAFAILPYLIWRTPSQPFKGDETWVLRVVNSRWLGLIAAIASIGLVIYGVSQGDWAVFGQRWQSDRFVHVMSLDFGLLCVLFPRLLSDDMARRGIQDHRLLWLVSLVPLIGSAAYLVLRPPLQPSAVAPHSMLNSMSPSR